MISFNIFIAISLIIILWEIVVSILAIKKQNRTGIHLGLSGLSAVSVSVFYLASILTRDYFLSSLTSSLYFISIDLMLNSMILFAASFTRLSEAKIRVPIFISHVYTAFEVVIFLINPFKEIAITYIDRGTRIAAYSYQMKPLYWMHLVYTYTLVAVVLALLLFKGIRVASGYRAQYFLSIIGILFVVMLNAVFLYLPDMGILSNLDISICTYGLIIMFLYWTSLIYPHQGMMNMMRLSIFHNINQGILLFDYNNELILFNDRAKQLLTDTVALTTGLQLRYFLDGCNIGEMAQSNADRYSIQCYVRRDGDVLPLRLDYRHLKNERGRSQGQMFVLSDVALETDLLTGFHNWKNFQRFIEDNPDRFPIPTAVVACDINGLSTINSTHGKEAGDQAIKSLAGLLRKYFQKDAYYVRGEEATLFVIDYLGTEGDTEDNLKSIQASCDFTFQYAITTTSEEKPDLVEAVEDAYSTMKNKKILDQDSAHSSVLNSLERALLECDPDTEEHVMRTRTNGIRFAQRIGLSPRETSQLELLCVMHDIGKIGVPLDILTKPGRLTPEEWQTMKAHSAKGYQIAMSSPELSPIADMILHHHEKWDGTGYPDGLSKETIPLLSRIIAIVDAYDAMISERPYKDPLTPAEAQAELVRGAGTQFDPRLVSEYIQMLKESGQSELTDEVPAPAKAPLPVKEYAVSEESVVFPVNYAHYYLNADMEIFNIDHHFTELTGYSEADLNDLNLKQFDLLPENERADYVRLVQEQLGRGQNAYLEHHIKRKDGVIVDVLCFGRQYYDAASRSMRSEIITCRSSSIKAVQNYAELEKARARNQLKHWEDTYRRDSLTGLLSHGAFIDDVEAHLLQSSEKVALLMFDVDKFKQYNDTFGHRAGDEFLIYIAQSLTACMRKNDLTCRMGGDEYAAALFFSANEKPELIEERIQQIFDQILINVHAAYDQAGISMGAAVSGTGHETFAMIYDRADQALYHSKENGRGRYTIAE